MSSRARPLPPDERRAALIAATLPLIREHGPAVSTRQIADAAGVAEGTIFGVFPDKDSLIRAAVAEAFDPGPVVRRLAALDPEGSFEDRVTAAVEILQQRLATVFHLFTALGLHQHQHQRDDDHSSPTALIAQALTEVLARHPERLRTDPEQGARLLRLVVFAGSHPRITDNDPLTAQEIADLVLHGIAAPQVAPLAPHVESTHPDQPQPAGV